MTKRFQRPGVALVAVGVASLAIAAGIASAGSGTQGPVGAAIYGGSSASINLPATDTALISLTLTSGSWSLNGTVLLNNLTQPAQRVPVVCSVNVPTGGTVRRTLSAVGLAPYFTSQGGDGATLPVSGVATITAKSAVAVLQCLSNTGPGGAQALAEQPQLTAIRVAQLEIQHDPFQS